MKYGSVICFSAPLVLLAAGWWNGLVPHSGSSWTGKVTIYPVECKGTVVLSNVCCGELDIPLNPTTFTVSVARQQVFESIVGPMTPLHNCEVQDYLNWQCTSSWDASESKEVAVSEGAASDRAVMSDGSYRVIHSPALTPVTRAAESAFKQDYVWVLAADWQLGQRFGWWSTHKGIWSSAPNYARRVPARNDPVCPATE